MATEIQNQIDRLSGKMHVIEGILVVLITNAPNRKQLGAALDQVTEALIGISTATAVSEQLLAAQLETIEMLRGVTAAMQAEAKPPP